ncbi:MAG: hypothetical protein ACRD0U_20045 [Acidimicrobiales bacterium]
MSTGPVEPLRRQFTVGVGLVLAAMVMLGGAIKLFGTGADRPEGAAERWLAAVGDTVRRGVSGDARGRAEKIGPLELAAPLLPAVDTGGDAAFVDLEVGDANQQGDEARVPYRVRQFADSGDPQVVEGTLVLNRVDDRWRVVALVDRQPGERVPSEGGAPPTEAPFGLWVGAFLTGVALCVLASVAVHAAGRGVAVSPG